MFRLSIKGGTIYEAVALWNSSRTTYESPSVSRLRGSPLYFLRKVAIRSAWFESVKGLTRPDGLPFTALDIDEPLWYLSRQGCSNRNESGACPKRDLCLCRDYCVPGLIEINTKKGHVKFAPGKEHHIEYRRRQPAPPDYPLLRPQKSWRPTLAAKPGLMGRCGWRGYQKPGVDGPHDAG